MEYNLMQVHLRESDRFGGRPLYEAIVARCREMGIAGASVFRAFEGYGSSTEIHKAHLMAHDLPLVVTIVDTEDNLTRLAPAIEAMVDKAMIAFESVRVRRVRNRPVLP